jgi:hypothetical protein
MPRRLPSPFALAFALGMTVALLVATTAWAVSLRLARPAGPLGSKPTAAEVVGAFGSISPYQVQRDMGAAGGKDADCSIYTDGDLDARTAVNGVTWAVTLCVVHRVGSAPVKFAGRGR